MQKSKQKFNALLDRHPWALQFIVALAVISLALTATFSQGINGKAQAAAGPTVIDTPATNAQWHISESQTIHWKIGNELEWIGMGPDAKVGYAWLHITDGIHEESIHKPLPGSVDVKLIDITMADIANPDGMSFEYKVNPSFYSPNHPYPYWFILYVYRIQVGKADLPGYIPAATYIIQGNKFYILPATAVPESAIYYSQAFDVSTSGSNPVISFDLLQATYNQPSGSNVSFAIGLLDANKNPLYTSHDDSAIDSAGYYVIAADREGELQTGYALPNSLSSKASQVRFARFRISMSTPDVTDTDIGHQPWVQNATLNYTAVPPAGEIGTVNFVATGSEPVPGIQTVDRGQTAVFKVRAFAYEQVNFVGNVQFGLDPITPSGSGLVGVPNPANAKAAINDVNDNDPSDNYSGIVEYSFDTTNSTPGTYTLTFTSHDSGENGGNSARTFHGGIGTLIITSTTTDFSLAITPTSQTVVKGQGTTYTVSITRVPTFIGTIGLITNITSQFRLDDVTAALNPTSITFNPTDVIVPGGPVLTKTSTLTIGTASNATPTAPKSFTVTGQVTGEPDQIATAQLGITTSDQAITLSLTIPVEPTANSKSADKSLPHFTVRVYDGLTNKFESTGNNTDAQDKLTLTISRATLPSKTYTVYARTNRHLWGRSTPDLAVTDTQSSYPLTFSMLKAGNLDSNNLINTLDLPPWINDYGKTMANLLGDLNNDGQVNVLDVGFLFSHYGLWGDQLPDETR